MLIIKITTHRFEMHLLRSTKIHKVTMQVGNLIAIHFLQFNTKICVIHDPPNISFDFTQRIHFCCCIESKTWRPRPKIRGSGYSMDNFNNWKTWKVRSDFVDFVPIFSLTQLIKRLTRWRQSIFSTYWTLVTYCSGLVSIECFYAIYVLGLVL